MLPKFCPHCGGPLSEEYVGKMAPVDPYEQLLQLAGSTAKQMIQQGKNSIDYKGDDGTVVRGWVIETFGEYHNEEQDGAYIYNERWGRTSLILTTEGELYTYAFHGKSTNEPGEPESQQWNILRQCAPDGLVGSKGKPFSEVVSKLERLPWRY